MSCTAPCQRKPKPLPLSRPQREIFQGFWEYLCANLDVCVSIIPEHDTNQQLNQQDESSARARRERNGTKQEQGRIWEARRGGTGSGSGAGEQNEHNFEGGTETSPSARQLSCRQVGLRGVQKKEDVPKKFCTGEGRRATGPAQPGQQGGVLLISMQKDNKQGKGQAQAEPKPSSKARSPKLSF